MNINLKRHQLINKQLLNQTVGLELVIELDLFFNTDSFKNDIFHLLQIIVSYRPTICFHAHKLNVKRTLFVVFSRKLLSLQSRQCQSFAAHSHRFLSLSRLPSQITLTLPFPIHKVHVTFHPQGSPVFHSLTLAPVRPIYLYIYCVCFAGTYVEFPTSITISTETADD